MALALLWVHDLMSTDLLKQKTECPRDIITGIKKSILNY